MPTVGKHALYAAFKAKDARFDGRFFVGVSSTGIYCRPVCRAKMPKEENCTFYESAAAAEQAGYRPCLLCRPELAPGAAPVDATSALAVRAARFLEENCGSGQNIAEYGHRFGYSERHLRRAFMTEFHVSPVQYLQTCRLLLAKNLLTDTNISMTDVAMAAGFGSLRRFNALFREHYRMPPSAFRKQIVARKDQAENVTVLLGYRPPYQWEEMLRFLAQRAIPGVEKVADNAYFRTVYQPASAKNAPELKGWLRVGHTPEKNALAVTVSPSLMPFLSQLLARVRQLFDLHCDPDSVYETLVAMNSMRPGLCVHGTRLPGSFEPFEMAVRAILGQQVTVKAASTLAGRLATNLGVPIDTGMDGLTHAFPAAQAILTLGNDAASRLGSLGVTQTRANSIIALASCVANGEVEFSPCLQPEAEIQKLTCIPGIGVWTAHYIAMRAMNWPDAFPHTDLGVKKALAPISGKEILRMAEAWRPWRAYATINLWNFLSRQTTEKTRQ